MNQADVVARIAANPRFWKFVSDRNRYSNAMTAFMVAVYFGYLLLVAFGKPLLGQKFLPGGVLSVGIPLGVAVVVFTVAITWIYVRRANKDFDTARNEIVRDATR